MAEHQGDNRLPILAADIRAADGRCRRSAEEAAGAAVEAGHKLIEAKGLLAHGAWGVWLQDHAGLSDRTAQRYMQLARAGLDKRHVADLGIREASRAIAKIKRPPQPDPAELAWVEEMLTTFWALLFRYAHLPQARRRALRMDTLDEIMSKCEEPDKLARVFLLKTQEIEDLIAAEGQHSIPAPGATQHEMEEALRPSVRSIVARKVAS